jgi:SAM-dependent methyltransferase
MKIRTILNAPLTHIDTIKRLNFLMNYLKIAKNESVISIGVGSGFEAYIASYYSESSVGIDISKKQIKLLKDNEKLNNINFYCIDATKPPPKKFVNNFNKCICMDVFEHVGNPEALLDFIERVLVINGIAGITLPLNIEHGIHNYSIEKIEKIVQNSKMNCSILIVKENKIGVITTLICNLFQKKIYPPKEANIFEELTCHEILNNPKRIHNIYKFAIALLFKLCSNSYKEDKNGNRAFILAKRIQ